MKRRILSMITALSLCLSLCPTWAFAVDREPGLCAHHPSHTEDCGYIAPTEGQPCGHQHTAECYPLGILPDGDNDQYYETGADAEILPDCQHAHDGECGYVQADPGAPCGYKCRICPIEDLIAALPSRVTENNRADVEAQLQEILDLCRELSDEEAEQVNLSRCYALQAELDAANAPMPLATGNVELSASNREAIFTAGECGDNCQGHIITQNGEVQYATILVESGTHNITFQDLNPTEPNVGVMPGATMNLTLEGNNTIKGYIAGIYVPNGAILTIGGDGSLNVSGNGKGAGIGGAMFTPDGSYGNPDCGTVIINGGTINATGGSQCAGIGGGCTDDVPGNGGDITINGGTVTATGGNDQAGNYGGAGIGGGGGVQDSQHGGLFSGCGGRLTINGGHVTLAPGQYDSKWSTAYGFGAGSGDVSGGTCELTLADENYLTVDSLYPKGKYTINADPTEDMIVVPEGLTYNGQAQELDGEIYIDASKTGTGTFFGQKFTVKASADGWVLQDLGDVINAGEYTAVFKKDDKEISKTFTVAACPHTGTKFTPAADGKHTGNCETCHQTVEAAHTWDNGACTACKVKAAAMSVNGSATTYYTESDFASAFAAENDGAAVTLLGSVNLTRCLDIPSDKTFTLDLNKELHFTDADEAGGWALDALRWGTENGVLNGYGDGRLNPKGLATRAQVAQMLKNFLEK